MKKYFIALVLITVFIWSIWIVIPTSTIQDRIEGSVDYEHFSLETDGLKKKPFYKIEIDNLTLKGYGMELVSFKNIQAPIELPSLLSLKLNVSFEGNIGKGKISGIISRTMNKKQFEMNFSNANVNDFNFLNNAGIAGSGTLSGNISMINNKGHIEFESKDADFQPVVFSGNTVPLNFFNSVRGVINIEGDKIHVSSLALEGKDIYARLKGEISDKLLDLSMEIMPGSSFLDNPLFLNALKQYKVSPGYYVIHVRRDIRRVISSSRHNI